MKDQDKLPKERFRYISDLDPLTIDTNKVPTIVLLLVVALVILGLLFAL